MTALSPSKSEAAPELYIIPMRRDHVAQSVAIHLDSFEHSFLSSLGSQFLRLMYQSFLEDRRESALVCVRGDTDQVVGFVCGSEDRSAYLKQALYRYLPRAIPLLFMASVRRPEVAIGLLRRSIMLKRILTDRFIRPQRDVAALPAASLMSVAVDRKYRGWGVGERLVRAYIDLMTNRGVAAVKLGVLDSNQSARRLFERLGWNSVAAATSMGGAASHYYICDLDHRKAPS